MTDGFNRQHRRATDEELDTFELPPPDLRRRSIHEAAGRQSQRSHAALGQPLTLATAATLVLAIAAVGTLLYLNHSGRQQPQAAGSPVPVASASPSATASPVETPSASPTTSATPSPAPGMVPWPEPGHMMVSPSGGPVGTRVTITGTDCSYKGQPAYLVFQGGTAAGTFSAVDIPNVPVDSGGHFRVAFTIPATMGAYQGQGGGPTRPGRYGFGTTPPFCGIGFTVT